MNNSSLSLEFNEAGRLELSSSILQIDHCSVSQLQKQEQASFAVSAKNLVRAVESRTSQFLQSSPDATAAPPPKPQVEKK